MGTYKFMLFLVILFSFSSSCVSWFWYSSSPPIHTPSEELPISREIHVVAEFSIDALSDDKGSERIKNAKRKLVGSGSCWHDAYQGIFGACSEIAADDNERRKRFAWDLSNCFQKDSGRAPFPSYGPNSSMKECLEKLDSNAIHTYRGFFLETNSICHQLQSDIFRRQTERLVNVLKRSAEYAEEKLETIEEKSEHLLQDTKDIHNSLTSLDGQTQQVAQTASKISNHISEISNRSEAVFAQSEKISASQIELRKGQDMMKEKMNEGIVMLQDSYHDLDKEIGSLRAEAVQIEREITRVGDTMSTKMNILQKKADDIGSLAGVSLERQKALLQGQSEALGGFQLLTKFHSQALEESRDVLQKLTNFGHEQQKELLQRQGQLQQAHDHHLIENSKSMLAAQKTFEQKQATMFINLDKLLALNNSLLLESRLIKAIFLYSVSMFVLYMFTSTKQTYTVRHRLFVGLLTTFLIEFTILRFEATGIEQQKGLINLVRSLFVLLAMIQILHAIFTYRDYEMLNYVMLKNLTEEVNNMRKKAELCWQTESEVDWSTWVDREIPDGVDNLQDPDYHALGYEEEVGDNSNATSSLTTRYNLRTRRH